MKKFEQYLKARPECIRYGQHLFNTLYGIDPDLANKIRGTDIDPFYNDRKVEQFLDYVEEHLV